MYIWGTLLDRRLFQCNYQGFIFQGHGKSEGPRAYAVSMEHVICQFDFLSLPLVQVICERYLCFLPNDWQVEQDILRHCGFLKSRYPGVPIFIYGDLITDPEDGYNISLLIDLENLPVNKEELINDKLKKTK